MGQGEMFAVEPVISLHDARGKVVWVNRAPLGVQEADLLGSCPWDWVREEEKDPVKSRFSLCIALGEPQKFRVMGLVYGVCVEINCKIDATGGTTLPIIARTRVLDERILLLTKRERQILTLMGSGVDTKAIARRLQISRSAVDTYRHRAKEKLGIKTIVGLAIFAACNFEPDDPNATR